MVSSDLSFLFFSLHVIPHLYLRTSRPSVESCFVVSLDFEYARRGGLHHMITQQKRIINDDRHEQQWLA